MNVPYVLSVLKIFFVTFTLLSALVVLSRTVHFWWIKDELRKVFDEIYCSKAQVKYQATEIKKIIEEHKENKIETKSDITMLRQEVKEGFNTLLTHVLESKK